MHEILDSLFFNVKSLRKDIPACLFSAHNTTSLSRHKQACLLRVRLEKNFFHHRPA